MKAYMGLIDGKGRGVLATEKITCGEVIERAPVINFPKDEWRYIAATEFSTYCYYWGKRLEDGAIVLGLGSLYNHSYKPNARFIRYLEENIMEYVAVRDIEKGEEITINYNGLGDNSPLWFDVME